jgi:predicted PhzF superfamily epimerase YddE/YHI9
MNSKKTDVPTLAHSRRALLLGRAYRAAAAMATLPYVTVDAFTTVKFRGNPAAVVVFPKENTADALDLRQRQAAKEAVVWTRGLMPARTALAGKDGFPPDTFLADVAREMHLSETAFVKMRPPPRQKKQPSAEGEADVAPSGTKSRVSFPFDDAGSDGDARDEGVDGASTNPPSPALSVASKTSSAGSKPKLDRDAVVYVEYDLRWFTRAGVEVDLCGHATLAAAHALYELGPGAVPDGAVVRFHTRGGVIPVARVEDKKKRADEDADGAANVGKKTGPLLELVLPCAPPRLAALGGKDVAPAADDSDDDYPADAKDDKENEETLLDDENGDGAEGEETRKKPSETFATPPREAGVFFNRGDVAAALGVRARDVEAIVGRNAVGDVFVCLTDHAALRRCVPDMPLVRFLTKNGRGLVACAAGGAVAGDDGAPVDFSTRFFGPNIGIDEDPVTGSAFCGLAPYWQNRLGRKNGEEMVAHQASARGGVVRVAVVKKRSDAPGAADETKVHVRGRAVSVLKGEILSDGFEAEQA